MFQIQYEFDLPIDGRECGALAVIEVDAEGSIDIKSIEICRGPKGFLRFAGGQMFCRAARYLKTACWQDVLLQFEIRRQEIEALAARFERFPATSRAELDICAARSLELRAIASQVVR